MNHAPFLLKPAAKDYLWGGNWLNEIYEKGIAMSPLAETWECSTHPDGESLVATGSFAGSTLGSVLREHPEFLGSHPLRTTEGEPILPVLVKLIDARRDLSVQVHPDDEYAKTNEGCFGKTEFWYILQAKKGAKIVFGFNRDVDAALVRNAIRQGTIGRYLNHVAASRDDLFFVEPGTVHAIGEGILLAEIQENSNLTYRLYDYDRVDQHNRKRPLHVEKALAVAKLSSSAVPRQPLRLLRYQKGCASEMLARCRYFQVERLLLNTETHKSLADFRAGKNSFHALLCTDGCGVLFGEDFMLNFFKGDCVFVPADSIPLKLHGKAQLLNVSC